MPSHLTEGLTEDPPTPLVQARTELLAELRAEARSLIGHQRALPGTLPAPPLPNPSLRPRQPLTLSAPFFLGCCCPGLGRKGSGGIPTGELSENSRNWKKKWFSAGYKDSITFTSSPGRNNFQPCVLQNFKTNMYSGGLFLFFSNLTNS